MRVTKCALNSRIFPTFHPFLDSTFSGAFGASMIPLLFARSEILNKMLNLSGPEFLSVKHR